MKKMTKQQLIEQISERTGLRRSEAKKAVEGGYASHIAGSCLRRECLPPWLRDVHCPQHR